MPHIAIISDIHGNLPALLAVLADIDHLPLDEVLVAGDLVGRGPQGNAVVGEIRRRGYSALRGNHEDYLINFATGAIPDDWHTAEKWAFTRWMARDLSGDDVDYLDALPDGLESLVSPELSLVHGSPRGVRDGLGVWTPDETLEQHLDVVEGRVLVCAHTHRSMKRRVRNGLVVNVGSVGLPFNADHRAQYAVLSRGSQSEEWQVDLRRVPYDRSAFVAHYHASGFVSEGGVSVQLLLREIETARPHLAPFWKWTEIRGFEHEPAVLADFLKRFRPTESLSVFMERVQRGEF